MSRRRSSMERRISLLDKMEEIAEEQEMEELRRLGESTDEEDGVEIDDDEHEEDIVEMDEDEDSTSNVDVTYDIDSHDGLEGPSRLDPLYEDQTEQHMDQHSDRFVRSVYAEDSASPRSSFQGSTSSAGWDRSRSPGSQRRRSFLSLEYQRDGSSASISLSSSQGRDGGSSLLDELPEDSGDRRRRGSVVSRTSSGRTSFSAKSSRRRRSMYRPPSDEFSTGDSSTSTLMKTLRGRTVFAPRRSTKRNSNQTQSLGREGSSFINMDEAVDRLGMHEVNSDWENVAAAAAVVAASAQVPANRNHVQFSQDDYALVMLTLLNITKNPDDPKDLFTIDPVNETGYPAGGGKTEAERQPPYKYVLCVVRKVHFDEDERYYTVHRADTGTEQRADPGWMVPIKDPARVEAALQAAHRTARAMAEKTAPVQERPGPLKKCIEAVLSPINCFKSRLVPFYTESRASLKHFARRVLHGEDDFAVKIRFSGINFLVLCSFIYLFIEPVSLAFLPATLDFPVAIVGLVVWLVLLFELLFEYLIRPVGYFELMRSDKAFSPTTARHISRYHLIFEAVALMLFVPQFECAFTKRCGRRVFLSGIDASVEALTSQDRRRAAVGRICLGLTFLRAFGLVRHWKQTWFMHALEGSDPGIAFVNYFLKSKDKLKPFLLLKPRKQKSEDDADTVTTEEADTDRPIKDSNEYDQQLKNAATTGTALLQVNANRVLFLLLFIVTIFPAIYSIGRTNKVAYNDLYLLQGNNLAANSTEDCKYLDNAISSWLKSWMAVTPNVELYSNANEAEYVIWAQVLPVRCDFQRKDGVITVCPSKLGIDGNSTNCDFWKENGSLTPEQATPEWFAEHLDIRIGGLIELEFSNTKTIDLNGDTKTTVYHVKAIYNLNNSVSLVNRSLFMLITSMLLLALIGLTVMRGDASRLVLDPLKRMLKIVVRYAENPLQDQTRRHGSSDRLQEGGKDGNEVKAPSDKLGNYETERLINAISKIADLLRKCWGVAGAGIISSNLARTKDGKTVVFNPTVPGKRVYALFGFIGIMDFEKQIRALDRSVMILINDVARVVHDEVYRWALGDSGQCNKNLGGAFLMVFRIGDFTEVHDKKKRATDVVFNSPMKKNLRIRSRKASTGSKSSQNRRGSSRHFDIRSDGTLQLATLPGIQSFTDRAVLGCLKSFAGIHRDPKLQEWQKDFRLGAGVGAFRVNVIYGMDAGWAVEGAVGSEYKIDATYLSPHVNMASRMMSACKQYGVTILLSQAVQELLSKNAQSKLRHLDTVYVKGSSVEQRIYTYDARYEGADLFLYDRRPDQADMDAEAYTPAIWDSDQDLRSMRQHVSDEFMAKFKNGVEHYLQGEWKKATAYLQEADNLMIQHVLEEGYVDYEAADLDLSDRRNQSNEMNRIRMEFGDGPCRCLLQYMERRNGLPPPDWHGVRQLMSK